MRNADVLLRRFAKFPRPFAAKQVPTSQLLLLLLQANVTDDGERHSTFLGTTPGKLGSESTASKNRRRSNGSLRVHKSCGKQERFIYSKPPPNKRRVMNSGQPRFVTLSSYPSHHPPLSLARSLTLIIHLQRWGCVCGYALFRTRRIFPSQGLPRFPTQDRWFFSSFSRQRKRRQLHTRPHQCETLLLLSALIRLL